MSKVDPNRLYLAMLANADWDTQYLDAKGALRDKTFFGRIARFFCVQWNSDLVGTLYMIHGRMEVYKQKKGDELQSALLEGASQKINELIDRVNSKAPGHPKLITDLKVGGPIREEVIDPKSKQTPETMQHEAHFRAIVQANWDTDYLDERAVVRSKSIFARLARCFRQWNSDVVSTLYQIHGRIAVYEKRPDFKFRAVEMEKMVDNVNKLIDRLRKNAAALSDLKFKGGAILARFNRDSPYSELPAMKPNNASVLSKASLASSVAGALKKE